jgi:hypothetical protein
MRLRYFPFHRCRVQRSIHLSSVMFNLVGAIVSTHDPCSALQALRQMVPCSLHAFHPDLDYDSVGRLAAVILPTNSERRRWDIRE